MASWERISAKRTGVQVLPYYHMSGTDGFAKEFFDLVLSVFYAQHTNDFLFVFDMINPVTNEFLYFQHSLKKNNLLRFLPYFPSSGYNIRGRQDLIQPIIDRGPQPGKTYVYEMARQLFTFQDKIREKILNFFVNFDIPYMSSYQVGIVYDPAYPDPQSYLQKLGDIPRREDIFVYMYCPSKDVFQRFRDSFPRQWTLKSIQTTGELHTQTNEQKIQRFYLELAELNVIQACPVLVGTYQNHVCRLMGLLETRFREDPTAFRSLDTKRFSFY